MTRIILRKHYTEDGKYLGMDVVDTEDLTPEFLAEIKADKDDKKGWKKHRKAMKDAGYDIGAAAEDE